MTRHLLKLVWNRRRSNALIVAEILVSFVVVFAVLTGAITFAMNWRQPLGFDWHDVWNVEMGIEVESNPAADERVHETMMRLLRETAQFPQVEAVAASNTPPYAFSTESGGIKMNGRMIMLVYDNVTDDYAKVMRLPLLRGRWFSAEDDAAQEQPVVIDRTAARALFGSEDAAIGKKLTYEDDPTVQRVIGVIETYRKDGETSAPDNVVLRRYAPNHRFGGLVRHLMVRLRPGTPATFEEQLATRLQRVAPDVTFVVRHLDQRRTESMQLRFAPLIVGGVIGAFLISMVGLGLTGVLWQNVTRRTREIGLRRALGASGSAVHRQILLEVVLLATIAASVGSIIIWQLPVLGAFTIVTPSAFMAGFLGALATVYALTVLCGLYPSWLASRLTPATALRHE